MRYININNLKLPDDWADKAKIEKATLHSLTTSKERSDFFKKASYIWCVLKSNLQDLSHDKCWYCEAKEIRSSGEVDHFRPKNAVCGLRKHDGYWCIAFDWDNYRYSCELCNRRRTDAITSITGGKGTYFPLIEENQRAYCPNCLIYLEKPLLLDPTVPEDPLLLWFDESGFASPKYDDSADAIKHHRAKISIELYHLNHTDLKEVRIDLSRKIKELVKHIDMYLQQLNNPIVNQAYTKALSDLSDLISPESPYSSSARTVLRGYRDREWVEDFIMRA